MKEETRTLILYRLERAKESLDEANILIERGHANTFVNRLYYACFYAVSALLLTRGLSSAKHSGVLSYFNRHFIKEGIFEKELGRYINEAFELRQQEDYREYTNLNLDQIDPYIEKAENFIKTLKEYLIRHKNLLS